MKRIISGIIAIVFVLVAFAVPCLAVTINLTSISCDNYSGSFPSVYGTFTGYKSVASLPGVTITVTGYGGRSVSNANIKGITLQNSNYAGAMSRIEYQTLDSTGNIVPALTTTKFKIGWQFGATTTIASSCSTYFTGTVILSTVTYVGAPSTTNY